MTSPIGRLGTSLDRLRPLRGTLFGGRGHMARMFSELQEQRHRADYDHGATFEKLTLLRACHDAERARSLVAGASGASCEAFFTLLTVRRKDFRERQIP